MLRGTGMLPVQAAETVVDNSAHLAG